MASPRCGRRCTRRAQGGAHGANTVVGNVDHAANGFTPHQLLTEFDYGKTSTDPDGRRVREWTITAVDKEIEIAPGVLFPAWTYNGRVPGPTLRCVEGERLRIHFINSGSHPHTIHLHSIHPARMDGIGRTSGRTVRSRRAPMRPPPPKPSFARPHGIGHSSNTSQPTPTSTAK